ncbi:MAG: hypothetical protein RBU23_09585 [Candidatus Auribacterota bacterium]|jgi:hypothetical protein|nr:hypothetical protein [Candidatus Auribacterota bacterium]
MPHDKNEFAEITDILNREKDNINQNYRISASTITEIHKINSYIDQLRVIIARINELLKIYEKIKGTKFFHIQDKKYIKLVNRISTEYRYLISVSETLSRTLEEVYRTEGLHCQISGEMIEMKDQINRIIQTIDRIL